jgi:hypothetical protein
VRTAGVVAGDEMVLDMKTSLREEEEYVTPGVVTSVTKKC